MSSTVLNLEKQLPDILRALKRQEKVVVSYGKKKLALIQPLAEDVAPKAVYPEGDIRNDPLFGIWKDREDMADPAAYVRSIREKRRYDF